MDYKLGLSQEIGLKLEQRLVITQQMQQALQILQMQTLELSQWLEQELQQNPTLEDVTLTEDTPSTEEAPPVEEDLLTKELRPETPPETGSEKADAEAETDLHETAREVETERETIDWTRYDDGADLGYVSGGGDEDDSERSLENMISTSESLKEHLLKQLAMVGMTPRDEKIVAALISEIDDDGFYRGSLAALARAYDLDPEYAEKLLRLVQTFEPDGVGARDLRETLLIQLGLGGEEHGWTYRIVSDHLDDLLHKRWQLISRALGLKTARIQQAAERVAQLNPRPGSNYDTGETRYIIPDVVVRKVDQQYEVVINDEHLPHLRISSRYQQIFSNPDTDATTRDYLKKKIGDAAWIIRSIYQRNQTIYRVARALVNLQYDFIERGIEYLHPLTLEDVARRIEMSEATVSRVTSNKYIQIPRGIMRMRFLFSGSLPNEQGTTSSRSVHENIRKLIDTENHAQPLSDTAIHQQLTKSGLRIARRTVCKYREDLGILPAKLRRRPE